MIASFRDEFASIGSVEGVRWMTKTVEMHLIFSEIIFATNIPAPPPCYMARARD